MIVDGTLDDPSKAGVFRTDADQIVVELLNSVETAHVPLRASSLAKRMEVLLAFANGDTPDYWLHPVLKSVIVHFMIGYDHPFVDGNGRVARALFYWTMMRHGYSLTKFLSISTILREAPGKYQRAYLHTETGGQRAARTDLLALAEMHLLVKSKRGRKFVFLSPLDLPDRIAGL